MVGRFWIAIEGWLWNPQGCRVQIEVDLLKVSSPT